MEPQTEYKEDYFLIFQFFLTLAPNINLKIHGKDDIFHHVSLRWPTELDEPVNKLNSLEWPNKTTVTAQKQRNYPPLLSLFLFPVSRASNLCESFTIDNQEASRANLSRVELIARPVLRDGKLRGFIYTGQRNNPSNIWYEVTNWLESIYALYVFLPI